jgi:hypothetical protein
MANTTTIKINKETKSRLDHLKEHSRESYDEVLKKILYILNLNRKNPMLSLNALSNIDKSIKRRTRYTKVNPDDSEEDLEEDLERESESEPKRETRSESKNKNHNHTKVVRK